MGKVQKFYVVWKGRKTGIFKTWNECKSQVDGYSGAEYKSFDDLGVAQRAFQAKYDNYKAKNVLKHGQSHLNFGENSQKKIKTPSRLKKPALKIGKPILSSYAVDAACSGSPGPVEYRCVHTETRELIFRQGPFEDGTNNIGEFLALVHALAHCKKKGVDLPIYSDSQIAIKWVKIKKCKTNLFQYRTNAELSNLIGRAEKWLESNEYENEILKWETKAWGEIPADYGRKRINE